MNGELVSCAPWYEMRTLELPYMRTWSMNGSGPDSRFTCSAHPEACVCARSFASISASFRILRSVERSSSVSVSVGGSA